MAQEAEDTSARVTETSDASTSLAQMVCELKDIVGAYKLGNGKLAFQYYDRVLNFRYCCPFKGQS